MTVVENMSEKETGLAQPAIQLSSSSSSPMVDQPTSTSATTSLVSYQPKEKAKHRGKFFCEGCGFFFNKWHEECPNCERVMGIMTWQDYIKFRAPEIASRVHDARVGIAREILSEVLTEQEMDEWFVNDHSVS